MSPAPRDNLPGAARWCQPRAGGVAPRANASWACCRTMIVSKDSTSRETDPPHLETHVAVRARSALRRGPLPRTAFRSFLAKASDPSPNPGGGMVQGGLPKRVEFSPLREERAGRGRGRGRGPTVRVEAGESSTSPRPPRAEHLLPRGFRHHPGPRGPGISVFSEEGEHGADRRFGAGDLSAGAGRQHVRQHDGRAAVDGGAGRVRGGGRQLHRHCGFVLALEARQPRRRVGDHPGRVDAPARQPRVGGDGHQGGRPSRVQGPRARQHRPRGGRVSAAPWDGLHRPVLRPPRRSRRARAGDRRRVRRAGARGQGALRRHLESCLRSASTSG